MTVLFDHFFLERVTDVLLLVENRLIASNSCNILTDNKTSIVISVGWKTQKVTLLLPRQPGLEQEQGSYLICDRLRLQTRVVVC